MMMYRNLNLILQFLFIRITFIDADKKRIVYPVIPLTGYITKNIFPRLVDFPKIINVILSFATVFVIVALCVLLERYMWILWIYLTWCLWATIYAIANHVIFLLERKIEEKEKQIQKVDERNKIKK